ncbi:lipid-binding SYLF domain-containing protein [Desertivirga xinjiangensis]|uniref:lipid-binding SYLF domain-containing protein n=1 Tax=Desertivirga xinjiangensis TaxID=539206 RepID=UPI00210DEAEF|nr:lipid-binding SYLF domain-containing protein [Pedobacter xinjiangensis]
MKTKKNTLAVLLAMIMAATAPVQAQEKQEDKIAKSAEILTDFRTMKESIPEQLIQQAEGMVIIPSLINAGLGIGGKRGKGIAVVKDANGQWSDPVFVTLTGGSFGLQAGVQSVDLVLVFKNRSTLIGVGKGTFNLGGDLSVAAGPVGRSTTADTDYKLEAEVYSYSRSKGLFAGISLNGSVLSVDENANSAFYGKKVTATSVFAAPNDAPASSVKSLRTALDAF